MRRVTRIYPWPAMTADNAPVCGRHEDGREMRLRTLHSDSSRPGVLVGLYECPECGHEQRVLVEPAA